jgi:hypothetical protein
VRQREKPDPNGDERGADSGSRCEFWRLAEDADDFCERLMEEAKNGDILGGQIRAVDTGNDALNSAYRKCECCGMREREDDERDHADGTIDEGHKAAIGKLAEQFRKDSSERSPEESERVGKNPLGFGEFEISDKTVLRG